MPAGKGLADLGFWSITLGAWCYTFATTIGTALLPQMQGDLSVGLDQVTWVVTAAVVAGAIGIPPTPWLAARFGTKNLLVGSMIAFTVSSALIGAAGSLEEVILWRVCQAIFGAPIFVLSQSLCIGLVSYERRGTAMAIWSVALTTGWVFGPTAGAYLADWYSWRVSFFIIAPISVVATIACAVFLDRVDEDRKLEFDWTGFVALSVVLLAVQMVLNRGQRLDWLDSAEIIGWLALAALALSVYLGHTLSSRLRFIRWEVLRDWNLSYGLVLCALMSGMSLVPLVLIPPMLTSLKGLEVTTIGLVFVFRGLVQIVVMMLLGPLLARYDPRWLCAFGFLVFAYGCHLLSGYNQDVGLWDIYFPHVFFGIGSSFMWMSIFYMMYATVKAEYYDDAATLVSLSFNVVSSAGVALLVALLTRGLQINTEQIGAHFVVGDERLLFAEHAAYALDRVSGLATAWAEVAEQAVAIAYANVFRLMMWLSLGALPMLLLLPFRRPEAAAPSGR